MRTVLLGVDFIYDKNGKLKPIEINTNLRVDRYKTTKNDEIYNLEPLKSFIVQHNFTKLIYIGKLIGLHEKLEPFCQKIGIAYESIIIYGGGKTIPYIEDSPETLIIRSAYDFSAVVDEEYCKNKSNFMNLIKSSSFGSQFAYIDDNGTLVNNIHQIPDNGIHPNFLLKSVFPKYNKEVYPKFYKVSNQTELDIVLQTLTPEYFLMEFHYNPNKLYDDHIVTIRTYNLLFPPDLKSIQIGQYGKITRCKIDDICNYDSDTFEISKYDRAKYITTDGGVTKPKLLDTDQVEMADGTFKSGADLQIGDTVKTIDIANPNGADLSDPKVNLHIDYNTFVTGTTYTTNKIYDKIRVDTFVDLAELIFTDGTTWEDTDNSSYLILSQHSTCHNFPDGEVRFAVLNSEWEEDALQIGDKVILINSKDQQLITIIKEVAAITKTTKMFGGWEISVEEEHMFLTKSEDSESSYVAIEHNVNCDVTCGGTMCAKPYVCCPPKPVCACPCAFCGKA